MEQLAEVYLAKARKNGASDEAVAAIEDLLRGSSPPTIRRVEEDRRAAEPCHVEALRQVRRAGLSPAAVDGRSAQGVAAFYRRLRERGRAWVTRTPSATRSSAS